MRAKLPAGVSRHQRFSWYVPGFKSFHGYGRRHEIVRGIRHLHKMADALGRVMPRSAELLRPYGVFVEVDFDDYEDQYSVQDWLQEGMGDLTRVCVVSLRSKWR